MATRDIVVVGASAGGVEALTRLVRTLPSDLPAAMFVVLHTMPGGQGMLASILARHSALPISAAIDGEPIHRGHIYVAPPDYHLLLGNGKVRLSVGPTHNRNRPAIDPLFQSAAKAFGARVVGIVLTGFLDDGSEGLAAIQNQGGYTIVQEPADALVPSMPRHALLRLRPDRTIPLTEIGSLLDTVCREQIEVKEVAMSATETTGGNGTPTTLTCPECHGVINQTREGKDVKFECQVGHSFTPGGLMEAQNDDLERALWAAVRSLEEGASLSRKMANMAQEKKRAHAMDLYRRNAAQREHHAETLRDLLLKIERHDREPEIYETSA